MKQGTLKSNFIWNTVGNMALYACQWLMSVLVVNLSAPSTLAANSGLLALAMTASNMYVSMAGYGMRSYQVSDIHHRFCPQSYIRSRLYTCAAALVLCAVFCLANGYTALQLATVMLFLLYRLTESLSDVFHGIAQQAERMDVIGKGCLLRSVGSFAAFLAVLALTQNITVTVAAMAAVAYAVLLGYEIPRCRRLMPACEQAGEGVRKLLLACTPLALYMVFNTIIASAPKLFLQSIMGEETLGIYNPVTSPVLILQTAATYIFVPLITLFTHAYEEKNRKKFCSVTAVVGALMLAMLPAGWLVCRYLGQWGLELLFPATGYSAYAYLLSPMVVSAVLTSLVMFFNMLLTVMRCIKGLTAAAVCGLAAALACSAPMITRWQMQGATYALNAALAAQLAVQLAVFAAVCVKHFKRPKAEDAEK